MFPTSPRAALVSATYRPAKDGLLLDSAAFPTRPNGWRVAGGIKMIWRGKKFFTAVIPSLRALDNLHSVAETIDLTEQNDLYLIFLS